MIVYNKPYGGYLEQVTEDYFTQAGLRSTHNSVLTEMPDGLREQVGPWLADTVAWPPLLGEFGRAKLGAWGNYLGDIYNRGQIVDTPTRREVATASTLTMGLLGVANEVVRGPKADPIRSAEAVAGFFGNVGRTLRGEGHEAVTDPRLEAQPQVIAFNLGDYMSSRLGLIDTPLGAAVSDDVRAIERASAHQFSGSRLDKLELAAVAGELGRATASWPLRFTEMQPGQTDYPEGRTAAEALGRIGGYLRHGSQVYAAVRDHIPTYATAVLLNHGGATSAAFREITQIRDDLVSAAAQEGKAALEPGNDRQRGIFKMATHLLQIAERGAARRGSARAIDGMLNRDAFWLG